MTRFAAGALGSTVVVVGEDDDCCVDDHWYFLVDAHDVMLAYFLHHEVVGAVAVGAAAVVGPLPELRLLEYFESLHHTGCGTTGVSQEEELQRDSKSCRNRLIFADHLALILTAWVGGIYSPVGRPQHQRQPWLGQRLRLPG